MKLLFNLLLFCSCCWYFFCLHIENLQNFNTISCETKIPFKLHYSLAAFTWNYINPSMVLKKNRPIEYRSDDVTKTFGGISVFWIPCIGWSVMKNIYKPKLGGNRFMGVRDMAVWIPNQPHWNQCKLVLVPNSYEPGQFILISMGLIRYSCGRISVHRATMNQLMSNGVWGFSSRSTEICSWKMLKCKKRKFDDVTLQYSILFNDYQMYCIFSVPL